MSLPEWRCVVRRTVCKVRHAYEGTVRLQRVDARDVRRMLSKIHRVLRPSSVHALPGKTKPLTGCPPPREIPEKQLLCAPRLFSSLGSKWRTPKSSSQTLCIVPLASSMLSSCPASTPVTMPSRVTIGLDCLQMNVRATSSMHERTHRPSHSSSVRPCFGRSSTPTR